MSLGGVSSASAKSRRKGRLTLESLRDATVVITSASSGIGLATARAFARRRANVVLRARRHALLQQAARDCEALGGRSLAVTTDVTDPAQVRELGRAAASAFGGIDVWINNAGTSMWGPFEAIPLESQARLIEINLLGAINGSHAALPHFFDRGGRGVIINVVSIFGRVPMPWAASYSASKFGLAGFTEALRSELAAHSRIKVCGVYPAYVDTPTYLNSANYTGRALRPVPPVVAPERVAERIAGLAPATPRCARRCVACLGRPVCVRTGLDRALGGPAGQALLVAFGAPGGRVRRWPVRDGSGGSGGSWRMGHPRACTSQARRGRGRHRRACRSVGGLPLPYPPVAWHERRVDDRGLARSDEPSTPPHGSIEEGKIVEEWEQYDNLGFLQQLGLIPEEQ
jgi:NAD(P)-dependent dehydrogenase (short-subunit alcohol dehydrogenase family)